MRHDFITVGELKGEDIDNYLMIIAKGNTFGRRNPHYDIPQLLSMYKVGKLNIDDMITRQYTLEPINEGYQDMLDGKNIRGVIRYSDEDR